MNYKEHLKVGILSELIVIFAISLGIYFFHWSISFSYILLFQLIIIMLVSPLSPDLDHYNGKLRELWIGLGLLVGVIGVTLEWLNYDGNIWMFKGIIISLIPFAIPYFTTHRGIIHSILFNVIYGGILYFVTRNIYVVVIGCIGFYSHLVADREAFKII